MSELSPLSPAAQAVLDAFRAVPDLRDCPSIAAALRAAADQECRPSDWNPPPGIEDPETYELGYASAVEEIKARLHCIAAELEGAQ